MPRPIAHAAARHDRRLFRQSVRTTIAGNQPADHRPLLDQARQRLVATPFHVHVPGRAAPAVATVVFEHGAAQRHVRGALQAAVHGRDDLEALGIDALAEFLEQHLSRTISPT